LHTSCHHAKQLHVATAEARQRRADEQAGIDAPTARSASGVSPDLLKNAPPHHTFRCIEPQHAGRHSAYRIDRFDNGPVEPKVIVPSVLPGIEETDQIARRRHGGYVRTFVSIANHARIRKIVRCRLAAVLPANDVIDFVRERRVILVKQTIFTPEHRPLHHFGA
jgi:hypothetical protein